MKDIVFMATLRKYRVEQWTFRDDLLGWFNFVKCLAQFDTGWIEGPAVTHPGVTELSIWCYAKWVGTGSILLILARGMKRSLYITFFQIANLAVYTSRFVNRRRKSHFCSKSNCRWNLEHKLLTNQLPDPLTFFSRYIIQIATSKLADGSESLSNLVLIYFESIVIWLLCCKVP